MGEILTESFCERCGTRYTFEPVDNRRKRLSAIGTLGRGIRHFVSDPGSSLDEAFAVARSETEQRSTSSALEAFHRTFNFCLSCRQYTCADCWNTVEGRCLSCAPTPDAAPPETRVDTPVLLAPMGLAPAPAPTHTEGIAAAEDAAAETEAAAEATALAEADARVAAMAAAADAAAEAAEADAAGHAAARSAAEADARAAAEAEAAAIAARIAEAEAAAVEAIAETEAAAVEAVAEAEARAAAEADARAAKNAADAVLAFEPGLNLDEQIAAYERQLAAAAAEPEATVAAEAEPVVEAAPPAPPVEPIPTAIGTPLPTSAVNGPVSWPDPEVAAAAFESYSPDAPTRRRSRLQAAAPSAMPAAARACPSCGLSLSASARFCRRCGTPQQADVAR